MRELHFNYNMRIEFENPVVEHKFSLRCIPITNEYQQIKSIGCKITPSIDLDLSCRDGSFLSDSEDCFGNKLIYGAINEAHNVFEVTVEGEATAGLGIRQTAKVQHEIGMFISPSKYTVPGKNIMDYYRKNKPKGIRNHIDIAMHYLSCLNRDFVYTPGVTGVNTTAEEAMKLGAGVCQDYAHILISLCRLQGIPARYVVGMLIGEGASHAWVDIEDAGYWYQLDPTNNKIVSDEHIRFSCGRDYDDCVISKGIFKGSGNQRQEISVVVKG